MTDLKNWQKEFDELRGMGMCCNCDDDHRTYKSFIKDLLKSQQEQRDGEWVERIKKTAKDLLWNNTQANGFHVVKKYHLGVNDLLSSLLKESK